MKRISVRLHLKNGKMRTYTSDKSPIRIIANISLGKFLKAYLYCSYGKKLDVHNKMVMFYNDAWITDPLIGKELATMFWQEN